VEDRLTPFFRLQYTGLDGHEASRSGMADEFDLIVIGAGPAGASGAAEAAAMGKRVALVERQPYLGGAGLNTGTIPAQALRETAAVLAGLRQRGLKSIQWSVPAGLRVEDLLYHRDVVIEAAWGPIQRPAERQNIRVLRGTARVTAAGTVSVTPAANGGPPGVAEETLRAGAILVATGASPRRRAGVPYDHPLVCDSDSLLALPSLPRSLAVVGAGAIGCEFANIFHHLGAEVTLIEAGTRALPGVDGEMAVRWQRHQERQGARFIFGDDVAGVTPEQAGVALTLASGGALRAGAVLFAVGREGNARGMGLEALGVRIEPSGAIAVDEHFRTSAPGIYAAGDVIGFPALASTSAAQARAAVRAAFGSESGAPPLAGPAKAALASGLYPRAVYTIPEIAMVGRTEEDCQAAGQPYVAGRASFERNTRAQIAGDSGGLLKLLFAPEDRRLLGVHIFSAQASELIHLGAQALAAGAAIDTFTEMTFTYPSLSEAYRQAAWDGLGRRRGE
jgi:NAD(P) transhydrogenase